MMRSNRSCDERSTETNSSGEHPQWWRKEAAVDLGGDMDQNGTLVMEGSSRDLAETVNVCLLRIRRRIRA